MTINTFSKPLDAMNFRNIFHMHKIKIILAALIRGLNENQTVYQLNKNEPRTASPYSCHINMAQLDTHRYPDEQAYLEQIATALDVKAEQLALLGGSDQGIGEFIKQIPSDYALFKSELGYITYKEHADNQTKRIETFACLPETAEINLDALFTELTKIINFENLPTNLLETATENKSIEDKLVKGAVFLDTPNNPYGTVIKKDALFDFILKCQKQFGDVPLMVLDQAYVDYQQNLEDVINPANFVEEYKKFLKENSELKTSEELTSQLATEAYANCIFLRTFSKAHGMAGLRVGLAIATKPLIEHFFASRRFVSNVNIAGLDAACRSLTDAKSGKNSYYQKNIKGAQKAYETLTKFFDKEGIKHIKHNLTALKQNNNSNFVAFSMGNADNNLSLAKFFKEKRILIRQLTDYEASLPDAHPLKENFIRLTLTNTKDIMYVIKAIKAYQKTA